MKIGIYDPYLDSLGGGEKYMLTAASCLSREHTVSVMWDKISIKEDIQRRFKLDLSRVHFTKNIFSPDVSFFQRLVLSRKYDRILYLSDGSIPFVASDGLILHFQFPIEWVNTSSYFYRLKRSRIREVIVNSAFTKSYIDKKFSWDSQIIYPPIETEKLLGTHKKEKVILTVGRYNPLPGGSDFKKQTFLIQTFKKLVDRGLKGWKFIVVTSFQERDSEAVDLLEQSIGSSYPIEIKRNISHETLTKYYKSSSIYWHASGFGEDLKVHPERAEHFGIATVEAMSAGAVPIVIKAGGQTEIVKDEENGFLWENEEELMKKTLRVITDQSLWKEVSTVAQESSLRFSDQAFCQKLTTVINEQ